MSKYWIMLIIALYAVPLLAVWARHFASELGTSMRDRGRAGETTLFILLALAAACYAFPSSADKGGPTNPPATVRGVIRLYHEDATGRLVPLDAKIKEMK